MPVVDLTAPLGPGPCALALLNIDPATPPGRSARIRPACSYSLTGRDPFGRTRRRSRRPADRPKWRRLFERSVMWEARPNPLEIRP